MKKLSVAVLLSAALLILTSCSLFQKEEEELVYLGLNAVILDIDAENKIITVNGVKEEEHIWAGAHIDCKGLEEDWKIFTAKSEQDFSILKFDDLKISDKLKVSIREGELNKSGTSELMKVEQIEVVR